LSQVDHHDHYRQMIQALSDRLVEAQRPIRILDAIKWDPGIQAEFFERGCKEQPAVDRAYYVDRPLGFDPEEQRHQFQALEIDVRRELGEYNPVGAILRRLCQVYDTVIRMLEVRGLP
jgi:hypothetical protein